jgi:hypothetical protein
MSIKITPLPIDNALERAMGLTPGVSITAKYLHVGNGLQAIQLDDAGRAITRNLKNEVGFIEILFAKKVNPYQWQMVVDIKNAHNGTDFNFSEFTVCDDQHRPIAIYGNATQAIYAVTELLDNALIAINLVLAAFPANSIVIEHHNLPLNMFFDREFKEIHLAVTGNTTDILRLDDELKRKANATDFGAVGAFGALTQQLQAQADSQAGVYAVRQYTYHGNDSASGRTAFDRNYNPGGSHDHANYDRMSGNAEVTVLTPTGQILPLRHSDYLHQQAVQGAFLAVEDVPLPPVPASVTNAGDVAAQTAAMREVYSRYQMGQFPVGFKFMFVGIEVWTEPFTGNATETFNSFRHQQRITDSVEQYRLAKWYFETGAKDLGENLPINQVYVAGLKESGEPILGILKGRYICRDLSALGDLRPWLDTVDDPVMDELRGITAERFSVRESADAPGKLDEILAQVPGLDGAGAYLEEWHNRYGTLMNISEFGSNAAQNAAYYHRFGGMRNADASNRSQYKAGFNTPTFFKALNARAEVLPHLYGAQVAKTSTIIPYELILYHPAMAWNPLQLTVNATATGSGTQADPYNGISRNAAWYHTPDQFYSGNASTDIASTGNGAVWVRGANNVAHPCRASGIYVNLPPIAGIGTIRQRYPIYKLPQDGSYAAALSRAYHTRHLRMTDTLSAQITGLMHSQITNQGVS